MKFKSWLMACLILIMASALNFVSAETLDIGERAAVKTLGMEADYAKLFSPQEFISVIVHLPGDGSGKSEFSFQYDSSHTTRIGYGWEPKKLNPPQAKLSMKQFLKECGKPDSQAQAQLVYGRVTLLFDKEGFLSEVKILFNK